MINPVARYLAARRAQPLRGTDETVHAIHLGTEHEATLRISDLEALVAENETLRLQMDKLLGFRPVVRRA